MLGGAGGKDYATEGAGGIMEWAEQVWGPASGPPTAAKAQLICSLDWHLLLSGMDGEGPPVSRLFASSAASLPFAPSCRILPCAV